MKLEKISYHYTHLFTVTLESTTFLSEAMNTPKLLSQISPQQAAEN